MILVSVHTSMVVVAITCEDIPDPVNGQITHVPDTHAPFEYGNEARYSCYVDGENRIGYGLTGGNHTRVCSGDGSSVMGQWTGTAPTCEREDLLLSQIIYFGMQVLCVRAWVLLKMEEFHLRTTISGNIRSSIAI